MSGLEQPIRKVEKIEHRKRDRETWSTRGRATSASGYTRGAWSKPPLVVAAEAEAAVVVRRTPW